VLTRQKGYENNYMMLPSLPASAIDTALSTDSLPGSFDSTSKPSDDATQTDEQANKPTDRVVETKFRKIVTSSLVVATLIGLAIVTWLMT